MPLYTRERPGSPSVDAPVAHNMTGWFNKKDEIPSRKFGKGGLKDLTGDGDLDYCNKMANKGRLPLHLATEGAPVMKVGITHAQMFLNDKSIQWMLQNMNRLGFDMTTDNIKCVRQSQMPNHSAGYMWSDTKVAKKGDIILVADKLTSPVEYEMKIRAAVGMHSRMGNSSAL
eukprot:gene17364-761_t